MQFAEYRIVTGREPLRQGDILESTSRDTPKWSRHLVVLTADCDLSKAKHQGRVTCVPALSTEEYLMEFRVPKIKDVEVNRRVRELVALLEARGHNVPPERVREWCSEVDVDHLIVDIGVDGPDEGAARHAIEALLVLDAPASSLALALKAIASARLIRRKPTSPEKAFQAVLSELVDTYRNTPGDAFFINAIGPDLCDGYFVYLRHLQQIMEPRIGLSPTRLPLDYRRISRLSDRYTHALSQQFGMVFMSIGLPDEYESARSQSALALKEKLS